MGIRSLEGKASRILIRKGTRVHQPRIAVDIYLEGKQVAVGVSCRIAGTRIPRIENHFHRRSPDFLFHDIVAGVREYAFKLWPNGEMRPCTDQKSIPAFGYIIT